MLNASNSSVFSRFVKILPQLRHFHPSKLRKLSKNNCLTISPEHLRHFTDFPSSLRALTFPLMQEPAARLAFAPNTVKEKSGACQ